MRVDRVNHCQFWLIHVFADLVHDWFNSEISLPSYSSYRIQIFQECNVTKKQLASSHDTAVTLLDSSVCEGSKINDSEKGNRKSDCELLSLKGTVQSEAA